MHERHARRRRRGCAGWQRVPATCEHASEPERERLVAAGGRVVREDARGPGDLALRSGLGIRSMTTHVAGAAAPKGSPADASHASDCTYSPREREAPRRRDAERRPGRSVPDSSVPESAESRPRPRPRPPPRRRRLWRCPPRLRRPGEGREESIAQRGWRKAAVDGTRLARGKWTSKSASVSRGS